MAYNWAWKFFKIEYKTSPKARKIRSAIQCHASAESAAALVLISDQEPDAVCVSVRELTEAETATVLSGWNV